MGTCSLQEKKIKNFWCDTLSSFCKNILNFKEECCMQGNLCLTLDKETSVALTIDSTIDGPGGQVQKSKSKSHQSVADDPINKNKGESENQHADIFMDPVDGIHNFLSDSLSSFCKNMIDFRRECSVLGKLCFTIDKENAMLVEINETVHCDDWALVSELLTRNSDPHCFRSVAVTPKTCPARVVSRSTIDGSSAASPIVIAPCGSNDPPSVLPLVNTDVKQGNETVTENVGGLKDAFKSPTEFRDDIQSDVEPNNYSCHVPGSSKRKRKQANPVSLSRLESSPKVIVIKPDIDPDHAVVKIGQCATSIQPLKDKVKNMCQNRQENHRLRAALPEAVTSEHVNHSNGQNELFESQLSTDNSISKQMPLMVHLLQQQTLAQLNAMKKAVQPEPDMSSLPALVSKASPMGNLDVLAERVSMAYAKGMPAILPTPVSSLGCDSKPLPNSPYRPRSPVNNTCSDSDATPSKGRTKTRHVNSLLDVPDGEVQQMLMALITSGQTKEACDARQCNICCPTLAYIRFRDRNRKNKSRFCMEKIEQVVNVKQYGGGSKYRDVQRMFTTHLRKLRAKHMCDKKCVCCEKLLLRESKKPNSNYLPHNVVPYKNLQKGKELERDEGADTPLCT